MKVLWLCNVMLPVIATQLGFEASNKEGWLSGLAHVVLKKRQENGITLMVAAPAPEELFDEGESVCKHEVETRDGRILFLGFREDTTCPHIYDSTLEYSMKLIAEEAEPDVVHCFGTEYPHTLAMCRVFPRKERLLISIQGLCAVYANTYFASMPEKVIRSVTLRDFLKKDSIREQQKKFVLRGEMEIEAVKLAKNVSGRTPWDKFYTGLWNPQAEYFTLNETLRPDFYSERWNATRIQPHTIFLSQGDYPIKGLHYMLEALPFIREKYPDAKVYVAGNSLVNYATLKQKLKISAYGKYLRALIRKNGLEDSVCFLGRLNAGQMKEQYLRSHLFVCCSTIENSPNSLGEAMLLGMPCVSADVGGITGVFLNEKDGILYEGYRTAQNEFDNVRYEKSNELTLEEIAKNLADSVISMWSDEDRMELYCKNARNHARENHDREQNYTKMKEIYAKISER